MIHDLVILGAGGGSGAILELIEAVNTVDPLWHVCGFLDDDPAMHGTRVGGFSVAGTLDSVQSMNDDTMFLIGVANYRRPRSRIDIATRVGLDRSRFATLVHPLASVSPRATTGKGVAIFQHTVVSDASVIRDHALISALSFIGHHAVIGSGAVLAPRASVLGASTIGDGSYIGANAVVKDGITVSGGAVVGMGAVVLNDVAADAIVVGNPARIMDKSTEPACSDIS